MIFSRILSRLPGWAFWGLAALLLFGAYPLALVCPVTTGSGLVFYLQAPVLFWAGLTACAWLLAREFRRTDAGGVAVAGVRQAWWMVAGFLLVAVWTLALAFWRRTAEPQSALETLALYAVPLAVALAPWTGPGRGWTFLLAGLWLANLLHGAWQWHAGFETVGLAGNRNWAGTLTLALAPWALLAGAEIKGAERFGNVARWTLAAIAGAAALALAWKSESRAVWLCLGAYAVLHGLLARFQPLRRGLLFLLLAGGLAAVAVLWRGNQVAAAVDRDIRLPMWAATVKMIADHPLTGVGPGNFRREFVVYKTVAHKARPVAAPVTEHPHNELLRLAAELGIPAALLWLFLLIPLLAPPPRDPVLRAAHFGAWMIAGTALFDKTLVQPPGCLAGLLFLGWLWRERLLPAGSGAVSAVPAFAPAAWRVWTARGVMVAAALFGLSWGARLVMASSWVRTGWIAERNGQEDVAFAAFARAGLWNPYSVEAQTLAGMKAANALRDSRLALPYLSAARRLEPDFAHLNGEIGAALGALGRHGDAWEFFRREAELYPFSPLAARRLLIGSLATGRLDAAREMADRVVLLDARLAEIKLGTGVCRRLRGRWLAALQVGDEVTALAVGREWSDPGLGDVLPDPVFFQLAGAGLVPPRLQEENLDAADLLFWRRVQASALLAATHGAAGPVALLAAGRGQLEALRVPAARLLRQAGWLTAVWRPQTGAGRPRFLVRRAGGGDAGWIEPATGVFTLLAAGGLPAESGTLEIPFPAPMFKTRNVLLADRQAAVGDAAAAPWTRPPLLLFEDWRHWLRDRDPQAAARISLRPGLEL